MSPLHTSSMSRDVKNPVVSSQLVMAREVVRAMDRGQCLGPCGGSRWIVLGRIVSEDH